MTMFLVVYVMTALMVFGIMFTVTLDGFALMNRATKVSAVISEILIGALWFPVLIFVTIWTIMKKIRQEDLQN